MRRSAKLAGSCGSVQAPQCLDLWFGWLVWGFIGRIDDWLIF